FRGDQLVTPALAGQQRGLAEPGARRDHGNVAVHKTGTRIDYHRIGFRQMDNSLRRRAKVIDQRHGHAQRARQRLVRNPPWNIAWRGVAADYRSRHAKAGRGNFAWSRGTEKLSTDALQRRELRG